MSHQQSDFGRRDDRLIHPRGTSTLKSCLIFFLMIVMILAAVVFSNNGNVVDIFGFSSTQTAQTLNFGMPVVGMGTKNPYLSPDVARLAFCGCSFQAKSIFVVCIALIPGLWAIRRGSANGASGWRG